MTPTSAHRATDVERENRNAPRRPASAIPAITGLRISPHGVEAVLVNISESGVLAECGERLKPGSAVTVVFEGSFAPRSMEGRVARNSVSSMGRDGRLRYHVGISFTRHVDLGPYEVRPPAPEAVPESALVTAIQPPAIDTAPAPPKPDLPPSKPSSTEFEVSLPSGDVVRNRW